MAFFTSLDLTPAQWVAAYGAWTLAFVALIILAKTGLVVMPFLSGDSLLFVTGTVFASVGVNVHAAALALVVAAVLGDVTNFAVGHTLAPRVLAALRGRWLNPAHLAATKRYFERFGASTIVIARFVPVVRTLAPFLAGAGTMHYARFFMINRVGAAAWVLLLFYAGVALGHHLAVRGHISEITLAIAALSAVPVVVGTLRALREAVAAEN